MIKDKKEADPKHAKKESAKQNVGLKHTTADGKKQTNAGLPASKILAWKINLRRAGYIAKCPPKQYKVIDALYTYRNVKGYAWPKHETLMKDTGTSMRTVYGALKLAKINLGITWQLGVPQWALTVEQVEAGINPPKRVNCYSLPLDVPVTTWQPTRRKRKRKG